MASDIIDRWKASA